MNCFVEVSHPIVASMFGFQAGEEKVGANVAVYHMAIQDVSYFKTLLCFMVLF